MNLTKEQILEEELSEDILEIIEQKDKPEELRYFKRYILDAMERYAQQQVKNLNIPAVMPSLPLEVISLLKQVRFTFSNYESGTIGKRMSEDAYSLLKKYVGSEA